MPLVVALDQAIRSTEPTLEVAIRYGILMYALHGDWRTWICAIDARKNRVSLRFLYGVMLNDPLGVLRAGSSVLKTWDFALDEPIQPLAVAVYVAEAVQRYEDYKANADEVLARSRAAAKPKSAATAKAPTPRPAAAKPDPAARSPGPVPIPPAGADRDV